MVERWQVMIPELTGREKRNVYAYIPESYSRDLEERYPVLYMFDGHNVFFDSDATYGKCWGMKEYMDKTGTEMIIVAVECNHSPNHGRLKEYSPFTFFEPKIGTIDGLGKITMDWFVHTLKPSIDRRYRTLPDREHTFIAGSSMGGLMSLYAITEYNPYFSRAAALSPSIWVVPGSIERMICQSSMKSDTVIYLDYGELEMENRTNMRRQFAQVTALLMEHGALVESRIVPGGNHCEASWEKQIPFFMQTLMYS